VKWCREREFQPQTRAREERLSGINFIDMLTRSFYPFKSSGIQLLSHQQTQTQIYQYNQQEVTPTFHAVRFTQCTSKINMNKLLAQKLLIEHWWNQHLVDNGHVGVVGADAVRRREVLHPTWTKDAEMDQGPTFSPGFGANKPWILIVVMVNQSIKVYHLTKRLSGVNFINVICTTFTLVDSKSIKNTV